MNFDKLMREEIAKLDGRKKLLLHCCCAPCSSACLERLKDFFDVTVFFYNPNIEDGEYERRKAELIRLIRETGWAEISDCEHDTSEFYTPVKGLENEKEGGARCEVCFNIRLKKTAEIAERGGFDYFTTTLTISPLKNAELINSTTAVSTIWIVFQNSFMENPSVSKMCIIKGHPPSGGQPFIRYSVSAFLALI